LKIGKPNTTKIHNTEIKDATDSWVICIGGLRTTK